MNDSYIIENDISLIEFLNLHYDPKLIKNLLKYKMVFVNEKEVSNVHTILKKNDNILIIKRSNDLFILYEDKEVIVVYKPYNLLTVADNKTRDNTLYHKVSEYLKKSNKNMRVFIVHRLDYETSGLVVFAKSKKVQELLQKNWNNVTRKYVALVHGNFKKSKTLKYYLKEGKNLKVYSSFDGVLSVTDVYPIKSNDKYTLVSIDIKTGKKHQIRVSLKEEGFPILGDSKYGIDDKMKHLYLCANELVFMNPITNKKISVFWNLIFEYKKLV